MTTKEQLQALQRGEKLDASTLLRLSNDGYIKISETTNHQTLPGEREFLFICLEEKGRRLLES